VGDELELASYVDHVPADLENALVDDVEAGWEDGWREFHRAVVVGRLWIGPPWVSPAVGLLPVVIDPGRAFGTGAHATTRLCLELLDELPAGSLLDVGCGSGVLAIAAAKIGHSPVTAVDVDPAAIEATRRNAEVNRVAVEARVADARAERLPAAEVAVANIALDVVEEVATGLRSRLAVTSGYLVRDRPELAGFDHVARRTSGDWAADLWRRE